MTRLTRGSANRAAPAPVRAVHLGLGAFHRAHQAVYTMAEQGWGIAAYTFRSTTLPRLLSEQDGLYTVQVRHDESATAEIVDSISRAHPGSDQQRWLADLSSADVALVTLTITEPAYRTSDAGPGSALGMLLSGLHHRYLAGGFPIALVPCDNLPGNGTVLRDSLAELAAEHSAGFREWLRDSVSFVDTVVDRITPAATEEDKTTATGLTGFDDQIPVVTEPYSEWLLSGDFPLGRPGWEKAGAQFVDDLGPYQQRKLWFLNGAHSLLAYTGPVLGCATIDEAVRHPLLSRLMEGWWDTAAAHASLAAGDLAAYRSSLRARFASRGIRHDLLQIAANGSQKLPARILPVLAAERRAGRIPEPAVAALAGWVTHLRTQQVSDPRAAEFIALADGPIPARSVLAALDESCGEDSELVGAVEEYRAYLG